VTDVCISFGFGLTERTESYVKDALEIADTMLSSFPFSAYGVEHRIQWI